jgi:predicted nucleotidyltransferase
MRREEALRLLRSGRAVWQFHGVTRMRLFGSVARDMARVDSDVDLLVEFGKPVGLFELFGLQRDLERLLARHVDLGRPQALRPEIRESVLAEAVDVA